MRVFGLRRGGILSQSVERAGGSRASGPASPADRRNVALLPAPHRRPAGHVVLLASLLALLVLVSFAPSTGVAFAQGTEIPDRLVLGMVPFHESDRLIRSLDPLAEMLSERLGRPVEATVATAPEALIEGLRSRKVDIGIFGPFALVLAEQRAGAVVILNSIRNGRESYRAQFIVRADSGIESLADLKGKVWAVPGLTSTSGYLFPRLALADAGIDGLTDVTVVNMVTHDATVMAVYYGDADFGTTFEDAQDVLIGELPDVNEKIKVIYRTDPIPNDGVVVRKELHPDLIHEIQQALVEIGQTEEGQALLTELFRVTAFVPATSERYEIVRRTYELLKDELQL